MKGIIKLINPSRGWAAVKIDSGYTVFEILEGPFAIELGDEISGDLESHGGETLKNITKSEAMNVYIQGIMCSREHAISLMRDH